MVSLGAVELAVAFLMPALRFFLPARDEGLYPHGAPFARQRAHSGLVLLHLTLAIRQLSQDSRSLVCFGSDEVVLDEAGGRSDWLGMSMNILGGLLVFRN